MNVLKRMMGNKPTTNSGPQEIIVRLKDSGDVLARGVLNETVVYNEGAYYFNERDVKMDRLRQADRDDACTLQGRANWFDVVNGDAVLHENVGWRFYSLKRDFQHLRDKIGFPVLGIPFIEVEDGQQ